MDIDIHELFHIYLGSCTLLFARISLINRIRIYSVFQGSRCKSGKSKHSYKSYLSTTYTMLEICGHRLSTQFLRLTSNLVAFCQMQTHITNRQYSVKREARFLKKLITDSSRKYVNIVKSYYKLL